MAQSKKTQKKKSAPHRKRLILLDTHAILHRAYHALPEFFSTKGEPTGALYGLSAMLLKIIGELHPDYIVACYDLPGDTFRHEAYEGYKAQRKETEEGLSRQIERARDVLQALNVPLYEKKGFEADDLLGTLAEKAKQQGLNIIIASGDMDTLQLVDDKKVQVYTLKKGLNDTILYDEEGVIKRFGFPPKLLPDYKGLRGDPSDNIIGIKGIGEKTATDLVVTFGSIENIYKEVQKHPEKFEKAPFRKRVLELLQNGEEEAEFSKILALIKRDVPIDFSLPEKRWEEGIVVEQAEAMFREFEFRSLPARLKTVLSGGKIAEAKASLEEIQPPPMLFEEGQNKEKLEEVKVALWLVDSNITNPSLEDVFHFTKTKDLEKATEIIFAELRKRKLQKVFDEIEKPLIPIVKAMRERGILLDVGFLKNLSKEYHTLLTALEQEIFRLAGAEFNVNSPKQLSHILFEKLSLSLKNHKKTEGGEKSTRESELQKMRNLHPIIPEILKYRELQKLLSTYIDNLPQMIGADGRLHAELLQAGAATGRMASQNPNLQNIPIKSEYGRRIRSAFVAEKRFSIVALDYAQIELKIAAILSRDQKLIEIFRRGGDVHAEVAAQVFGVPKALVDKEMRRRAKVINFGILYGMGVNALRENLGTTRAEAQKFYNDYFSSFSDLAHYLNRVKADAYTKGYTETFFGRRRYFEGIRSSIPYIRASAERMAINAPIQGTQADIIKIAMGRIAAFLEEQKLSDDVRLLLQVHDELLFEIQEEKVAVCVPKIKDIMEHILSPKDTKGIPLVVGVSVGGDWGALEPFV